jgi:hypothetical protein
MPESRSLFRKSSCLVAVLLSVFVFTDESEALNNDDGPTAEQQAITLATEYLIGKRADTISPGNLNAKCTLEVFVDSTTPLLFADIRGKPVWRVSLRDFRLRRASSDDSLDMLNPRDFEIFIDQTDGKLLKIESRGENYDSSVIRKPSIQDAERELTIQHEKFWGFPSTAPEISFEQALGPVWGDPDLTMEIVAYYTLNSIAASQPRPVWQIHVYGGHIYMLGHEDLPIYLRNYLRAFIDARTGEFLKGDNLPRPSYEGDGSIKPNPLFDSAEYRR